MTEKSSSGIRPRYWFLQGFNEAIAEIEKIIDRLKDASFSNCNNVQEQDGYLTFVEFISSEIKNLKVKE